jgi:hypothetical protein
MTQPVTAARDARSGQALDAFLHRSAEMKRRMVLSGVMGTLLSLACRRQSPPHAPREAAMQGHVALLGDSVFDNQAYTGDEPDVVAHLRAILPQSWRATLYAQDGATTAAITRQAGAVAPDVSHVVLSVGGNDALANIDLLDTPVRSTAEALELFQLRIERFERDYRSAVGAVLALARPTVLCTIYNGQLPAERQARNARMALMMFNDAIQRTALDLGLSVIELRAVCSEPSDYANAIEPSGAGGAKIAASIAHAVGASTAQRPAARVFG